jgi:hypothetical protein
VSHKQVIGKKRKTTWVESCADALYNTAPTSSPSSSPHKQVREETQGLPTIQEEFDKEVFDNFFSYTDNKKRKTKVSRMICTNLILCSIEIN